MAQTRADDSQLNLSAVDQAVTLNDTLTIDNVQPTFFLRASTTPVESDGLYRMLLSGGFFIHRNTAVAGDFSTFDEFFSLSNSGQNLSLVAPTVSAGDGIAIALTVSAGAEVPGGNGLLLEGIGPTSMVINDGTNLWRTILDSNELKFQLDGGGADFSTSTTFLKLSGNTGGLELGDIFFIILRTGQSVLFDNNAEEDAFFSNGSLYRSTDATGGRLKYKEPLGSGLAHFIGNAVEYVTTADGTVANTATETSLIGTGVGSRTLVTNFLSVGRTIRLRAFGRYSTDAITAGNLNIRFKIGSTTIISTGDIAAPLGVTNEYWQVDVTMIVRTTGGAGTVSAQSAFLHGDDSITHDLRSWEMISTSPVTLNTVAGGLVDLTADWSVADTDNTITCTDATLEFLN